MLDILIVKPSLYAFVSPKFIFLLNLTTLTRRCLTYPKLPSWKRESWDSNSAWLHNLCFYQFQYPVSPTETVDANEQWLKCGSCLSSPQGKQGKRTLESWKHHMMPFYLFQKVHLLFRKEQLKDISIPLVATYLQLIFNSLITYN